MSKRKVIVIAIDSLEADLIEKYADSLPNLRALVKVSKSFRIGSIYPPDSYPAWRSIFTGTSPAEHGLLFTADVFNSAGQKISSMTNDGFEGRTVWDELSGAGQRVCVLFPLTAFPAWPVNGLFVARSEEVGGEDGVKLRRISVYPESAIDPMVVPNLRGFTGQHPGEAGLQDFKARAKLWAERDADFALTTSKSVEWDFCFAYFMELDTIQHYFWRYCDPDDPMYVPNPYSTTIREFYEYFDDVVGRFQKEFPEATVVVLSDHGHQMRPVKTLNVNEMFRRRGVLSTSKVPGRRLLEHAKQVALRSAKKFGAERMLIRAGQRVPGAKKIYTAETLVDRTASLAYLSDFRGPKSYPEGGIVINRSRLHNEDYEACRERLMKLLQDEITAATGSGSALEWVRKREDLYSGPHESLYPDIVFRLAEGFGVGWDVLSKVEGTSYEHSLSSGGHSSTAVLLSTDPDAIPPSNLLGVRAYLLGLARR